jgi:hypothetical protein
MLSFSLKAAVYCPHIANNTMQTIIPLFELEKTYMTAIKSFEERGGKLTPDALIQFSLQLFQDLRVEAINTEQKDDDMLLFQCGTNNWYDEVGEHFSFNITRQLIMDEEDGDMFQLSWSLIYDPAPFTDIKSDNGWCWDFATLADWEGYIKSTAGYQKACAIGPRTSKLNFSKV